ncbi:PAP_central domain-containing protein, partial [Meloidogyne graminicola]
LVIQTININSNIPTQNILIPEYYANSQWINNSPKYSSKDELVNFLDEIYKCDKDTINKREMVKNWINKNVEKWLLNASGGQPFGKGFSMIVGGSTLHDTITSDSDMDILIIIPNSSFLINPYCKECQNIYAQTKKFCDLHDYIFGSNKWSLYTFLKNELEKVNKDTSFISKIENARIPLISIFFEGIDLDIMIAPIPYKNIPNDLDLTDHKDKKTILKNIQILDNLINEMNKLNDFQYVKSVLMLNGYRIAYREKFLLIDPKIRDKFTNLLKAVKLWAKRKHIYSNIFGYLSGTILTIMVSKICLIYPSANLPFLLQQFFLIYSTWTWPIPLITGSLQNIDNPFCTNLVKSWNLTNINPKDPKKSEDKMPVMSSLLPHYNVAFKVNEFTKQKIIEQMREAFNLFGKNSLKEIQSNNFWSEELFKELNYIDQYKYFIIIICAIKNNNNNNENCEFMKTKIRRALVNWVYKTNNVDGELLIEYFDSYHVISGYQKKKIW